MCVRAHKLAAGSSFNLTSSWDYSVHEFALNGPLHNFVWMHCMPTWHVVLICLPRRGEETSGPMRIDIHITPSIPIIWKHCNCSTNPLSMHAIYHYPSYLHISRLIYILYNTTTSIHRFSQTKRQELGREACMHI